MLTRNLFNGHDTYLITNFNPNVSAYKTRFVMRGIFGHFRKRVVMYLFSYLICKLTETTKAYRVLRNRAMREALWPKSRSYDLHKKCFVYLMCVISRMPRSIFQEEKRKCFEELQALAIFYDFYNTFNIVQMLCCKVSSC